MDEVDWLAERFEEQRAHLRAVPGRAAGWIFAQHPARAIEPEARLMAYCLMKIAVFLSCPERTCASQPGSVRF